MRLRCFINICTYQTVHFRTTRIVFSIETFDIFFLDGGRSAELCAEKSISGPPREPESLREWLSRLTDRQQCHIPAEAPPFTPSSTVTSAAILPPFRPPVSHSAAAFRGSNQTEDSDFTPPLTCIVSAEGCDEVDPGNNIPDYNPLLTQTEVCTQEEKKKKNSVMQCRFSCPPTE